MTWMNDPGVTRNSAGMGKELTRDEDLAFLDRIIGSDSDRVYVIEDADGHYLGNAGL
jgi:hypothetical protein